ncbi:MAG: hypothetical protein KME15_26905 [Drouetiella hepatica Uher 2000/2452]|uniref:Uncharacterized protein n=1 Tax=Drouetiella hepatica Uher 2000/2452 TaxID=904376 RepID=A0A951UQT7_9CYAN|nr:hypothetical protein [Drouetiella hepatica Uher 2000/2452]
MSLLHRDEPPETGVNNALAVEGHWLGLHFRVSVRQICTIPALLHCALHKRDKG